MITERMILVRIWLLAAAAVVAATAVLDRCGAVTEKRFRPWWGRPQRPTAVARRLVKTKPTNRYSSPTIYQPACLRPRLIDGDAHAQGETRHLAAWRLPRGGSSTPGDDWYERAARRQKERYYPTDEPGRDDHDNGGKRRDGYYEGTGGDYGEEDYYYGRDEPTTNSRNDSGGLLSSMLPNSLWRGNRQTGLLLLGGGLAVTFLGISLFFNRTLLRLGNLMFIAGVTMTLGPSRTIGYFVQPAKFRATACLALGIFLVLMGSPVFGIVLEVFGLLNLFGNMFPVVWMFAKNLPVLGPILKSTSGEGTGAAGAGRNSRRRNQEEERYDDDYDDPGSAPPPSPYYNEQDEYNGEYNYHDQSSTGQPPASYDQNGYSWGNNDDKTRGQPPPPPSRYY